MSGTTGTYGQIIQFTGTPTIAASETSNYDGNPAATVITAVPDYSTGYHLSTYLEFTGALEKSSSNYFITVGEGQIQISYPTSAQSSALTALDGKTVHVKGYFSGINSSSKFTVMLESAEEVAVPSITLEQYTYNLNADGGDAELHVTYTNMPANPQAVVIFYEANGTTPLTENPTWITASINNNGNIAGHIDVNEGDARSAYFKVKGIDGNNNEVYSDLVTINQAAAGPNIEFNNTSMTLAAGGESDRKLSFDYSGLGDNPTFSINYYEQDGTTAATYDHTWLTATIEGHKVNISAVANTGAERKAYFKVYGENGTVNTESNLVTITQAEAPTYAELPFAFDGGRAAIAETDGLYQDGLGSDYNNSPKLKFDGTGDWLLLQFNERPGTLTFKIKGNGYSNGSTSTFKVQTSADGTTYTDLATYTELGDTQTESFDNLDENVRYIKWIYTEKGATSGGNVALGDINLTAYAAPVASITVDPATVNVTAEGEDDGSLAIAYENLTITDPADFDIQYYDANNQPLSKDDKPDWMEASIIANSTQDGYVVSFSVDPNDGAARTAYFKVFAMGDQDFVYSNLVTINQAAYVVDYATLPFEWEGGTTTNFNALNGTSTYSVGDYGDNQGVYRMKLDADNDYIQIKTNEQPGIVTIGVKMIGGASTSTLTVQGSADGETFTNVEALTISGSQNDELTLTTTNDFAATDRYVRLLFTKGSNVGVGPITIAQVDHTPSITINPGPYNINCNGGNAELPVTTANLAENPQLAVVFCNSDGSTPASYNHDWISAEINTNGNVDGHISVNTGEARSAYFKVSGLAADNTTTVYSELVTINQAEYIPSIVFETASIDLAAGGETDRKISFDYSGLGDNPTFEVRRYESDGTTPAIYDWLTTTISGNKVKITVPANDGVARTAYFKVYGENGNVNTLSNLVTVNQAAHVDTYSLVTNVNQIVSGKHYIIANGKEGSVKVMAGQNSNNRASIDATASNQIISAVEGIYEFVINGPVDMNKNDEIISVYTIYDTNEASTGYLYAASSSANYLKTKGTLDNNGKWTIVIEDNDAATIKAQGSNSRNWMRNNGNLFSCYSTGQSAIYLYVKDNDNNLEYYGSEITYPENSIPDGGSIMVGAGSVVTVSNTFTNTDNASIIIEDGGQLVHENPVSATIQKNVTGYGSKSVSGWYLIASPVANLSVGCATTGSYDFFKYDEETYTWLNQKVTDNHITNFEQGIGYLYANSAATVIDYMGTLVGTNTKVTKAMSFACDNAGLKGFNLMGNPFSRNLVAGDMILNDTAVTTYYTIEGGSEFVARKISTNPIKPGQGFFVQASAEGQNLVFNPTAKGRNENNGYISIKAGNSEFTDNAFVQIANGNTLRKMTLSDNSSIVYVMNGGKDYAAARIDALEGSMPVCFKANKLGSYTITIEAKDIKTEYMHLIDKISHEDIDLLLDPSYTFIASDGDNASRFTLVFRAEGNANTTNDIFAYQNGDDIIVNGEGELQVFDVMGRMIATQHINGTETVNVNAIGVYIFKLNEKTQKIVVR